MRNALDHSRFATLFQLLFWLVLLGTLLMAWLPHPPVIVPFNVWDKIEHAGAFGVLSLLAALGYRRQPLLQIAEHLSFLGAMVEVVQATPLVQRDCDIVDWVADTIAIAVAMTILFAIERPGRRGRG